ncbi:MAG: lysophospholipid acyltransferase family protein [Labrys sp. (in: a-proteobacteria)]
MVDISMGFIDDPQSDAEPSRAGVRFSYSRPEHPFLTRSVIRAIEFISGQPRLARLYRRWAAEDKAGETLFAAGLRLLRIRLEIDEAAWSTIPREGPLLLIANHPFGVVDGLLMGYIATSLRRDVRIMTHSLLCQPPELQDYILPVDFGGTEAARQTTLDTRRRAVDWLRDGHALVVFPSGSVSTAQKPFSGPALESVWAPFVAKLATLPDVTTIPVYVHGRNSRLFQIASHLHYALRIALLFRETRRLTGRTVRATIGSPVDAATLRTLPDRSSILADLRRRTLSMAGPSGPDPEETFVWPSHIRWD